MLPRRFERLLSPVPARGARQPGPGLRKRIDPGFGACRRPQGRAVVKRSPEIPRPVPRKLLNPLDERFPVLFIRYSEIEPAHESGHFRHPLQHIDHEPRQPDALPLPSGSHEVHPVVPVSGSHQRQSMHPKFLAARERALAVLEKRSPLRRHSRRLETLGLIVFEQRRVEECDVLAQDIGIAGDRDVMGDHERKPQEIIGDPGADPHPARRMPPVLDISLFELTACREQNVLPRQRGI